MDTHTLPRTSASAAGLPAPARQRRPRTRGQRPLAPAAPLAGTEADPTWARPALLGLLLATALLYVYNLTSSGWANAFYSAAVQAGSQS